MAPLNLCFYVLFYVFLLSLFTRITSALFIYDKRTLLDIGHRCTYLLQDTLSTDPAWPLEILRNAEVNKGHPNNPRRRKKHSGRRAGIRDRLRNVSGYYRNLGSLRAGTRHHGEFSVMGTPSLPTFPEVLLAHASQMTGQLSRSMHIACKY